MRRPLIRWRTVAMALGLGATGLMAPVPGARAQAANKAIALDDLRMISEQSLPIGVLRGVALDYAAHGDPVSCPNLRRCDELHLYGRSVDLDGDGSNEWLVTDVGFTGAGAELDYVFKMGPDRRWKMIGRIEGLHVRTIGPSKSSGFLDIHGRVAGVCVEGRGRAVWNGRRYVVREGRLEPRPC